ncbi:MAG: Uma2 family endonuclease [Proteobacteria bacterium]|nr:Uma2 family endonuclease [Pseudomonadota bacterium]
MTRTRALAEITPQLGETSPPPVSREVLAQTEYRGPPWDLSLLEGIELLEEDGVPMASDLHRRQMNILVDGVSALMVARGRSNYYVSGDIFIYYTPEQARYVATHKQSEERAFMGPDFVFIDGATPEPRRSWQVWNEENRYPDVIAELLSPSTARIDQTVKKWRYCHIFRTAEYYLYEPDSDVFTAYHLIDGEYCEARRGANDRVYSEKLDVWFGLWQGTSHSYTACWLRIYESEHATDPFPTSAEQAQAERQRADDESQRADDESQRADDESQRADDESQRADDERRRADRAEAEVARLRALLDQ